MSSTLALAASRPRPDPPEGPFLVAGLAAAGAAAAEALLDRGVVLAWDGLTAPGAAARTEPTASALAARGARVSTGGDGVSLLDGDPAPRCLVKSPGIPCDAPLIVAAIERGLTVIDELELGWRLERRPILAVTGTNGKSTVAGLLAEALAAAGVDAPLCGNTHHGPPLCGAAALPGAALVCEVSSFQLEGSPTFLPELAALTNLDHDHLYRHRSRDRYAEVKRSMFVREGAAAPVAVLNLDDSLGAGLAGELAGLGGRVVGYGRAPQARWRLRACEWSISAARLRIAGPGGELELKTRLPGPHNALNALAALACADACGIGLEIAAPAISAFAGVPGRFQHVASEDGFDVVVDFAHNPAGIARTLDTAAAIAAPRDGRLIVVLSALDLYDDELCREMGAAAADRCERLILTTERFSETDAPAPVAGLAEGAAGRRADLESIAERRAAIAAALATAGPGDLVLVLGRGERAAPLHELSGAITAIDDAGLVREALA